MQSHTLIFGGNTIYCAYWMGRFIDEERFVHALGMLALLSVNVGLLVVTV